MIIKKKKGEGEIECFGNMAEDNNYSIVCEDECHDGIIVDVPPSMNTWAKVCEYIEDNHDCDLIEVHAC